MRQGRRGSYRFLSILVTAALAAPPGAAFASDTGSDEAGSNSVAGAPFAGGVQGALQEVTVMAQRTPAEVAVEAQKQAPNIIDIATAIEISRLPDVNTGEAVRRVPGISLETDTGEGRYINIRGLDADLNSTTFGGLRLPPTNTSSPSGAGRAVAFDSIPIGFIGAITVTKSNLPEQDAEALGGTIDITPKTVPADGKVFVDLRLGSGEELQRHTGITDLALTTGAGFWGEASRPLLTVLLTGSIYNDGRGIDDAEAGFWDEQAVGVPDKAIASFEERYYQYHRQRHGAGIDLGLNPTASSHYFVRYYDAGYTEYKFRQALQWNFQNPGADPALVLPDPLNPNGLVGAIDNVRSAIQYEKETLTQRVGEIGGENYFGGAKLNYHVGYTKGSYWQPYNYNFTFTNTAALAGAAYDNTTSANWPTIAIRSPAGFNVTNPANYMLTGANSGSTDINDHEWAIGSNLSLPTHWTSRADEELKFGVNARLREKTGFQPRYSLDPTLTAPLSMASALAGGGPVTYYSDHYTIPPLVSPGALLSYYNANPALLTTDPIANELTRVKDKEDVYAAYAQYQFGYGPLGVVAGVRVEHTRASYAANSQVNCPGGAVLCPVSTDRRYTDVFPSAQLRYEIEPDLVGRLALSSTLARPGFQQVTATILVDNNGNVTAGNPQLSPTKATAIDLALEKYMSHAGVASIGVFGKYITDYIVTNAVPLPYQVNGGSLGVARLFSFTNGSPTHLYGVEANFVKRFRDELPGPLAGLGVSANWTWVTSSYDVPSVDPTTNLVVGSRRSVLPSTSRNTGNAELLYDMYGLNLTLGGYYTSRNIFTQGPSAATDIWTQDRLSVDFGAQYQICTPVSVYFNAKNLTDTALKFTDSINENRVIQREFYGTTLQAGVNIKF